MKYLLTAVVFVVIFSILILIHEFGHFIAAKRSGIKVLEFGFGLPPRIWGKKKGDTIYSINWIPFGGFVRMFGDDFADPSMLKRKGSFVAQRMRTRVKVLVAGVTMNFLLAWLLLFFGFSVGMQPLLTADDVFDAVNSGVVTMAEGAKIKDVEVGSFAEDLGFKAGDILYAVDGKVVDYFVMEEVRKSPIHEYKIIRGKEILTYQVTEEQFEGHDAMGVTFFDYVSFPRVKIFDLDKNGSSYKSGLRKGDIIISANGENVFSVTDFEAITRGERTVEYEVFRDGFRDKFMVESDGGKEIIISSVMPEMPAIKAGFVDGDKIISVNGKRFYDSEELIKFTGEHPNEKLAYLVERNGERFFYEVMTDENGKIGALLSELMNYSGSKEMSVYNVDLLSSVVEIKDEKYPWHEAFYKAFTESVRLAKMTGSMFVDFVSGVISSGNVPDSVAGPVGIAQLTHGFVQEGFIPILRFVAILSLSLAVINILPFPALDGGRLLFVVFEAILGRRVNQKWESYIHAIGYALIILLILAVTYSDISRLLGIS